MSQEVEFFAARASKALVDSWRKEGQMQIIGQAELVPVLVARCTWMDHLRGREVVHFVDNDSAKHALVKASSSHPASEAVVAQVWEQEVQELVSSWYDRVPSPSNPADDPSRGVVAGLVAAGAVRVVPLLPPGWAAGEGAFVSFG
eukprot:2723957-Heterocapsa_arctica.AAC.1